MFATIVIDWDNNKVPKFVNDMIRITNLSLVYG